MLCKAQKQKLVKVNRAFTEEDRKRQDRKKQERKRELEKRERRKAFEAWSMFIRDGVREVL